MTSPQFAYAQARLQARHAERVPPAVWLRLDTSQSAEHFLETARGTSLSRWIRLLDRNPDARAVEAALDLEFRTHVDEVAEWVETRWTEAVRWTRWLPLLQRLDMHPPDEAAARLIGESDVLPFLERDAREYWYENFLALLGRRGELALGELTHLVSQHLAAMRDSSTQAGGWGLRAELARALERSFRRHPATPLAVFSHLGLTLLELERLRGAIVVRLLLPRGRSAIEWA